MVVLGYSLRTGTKGNNRLHKGVLILYKISSTRSAALGQTVSGFSVLSLFELGELKDERKGSRTKEIRSEPKGEEWCFSSGISSRAGAGPRALLSPLLPRGATVYLLEDGC